MGDITEKPNVTVFPGESSYKEIQWLHNLISCYLEDMGGSSLESCVDRFVATQGKPAIEWVLREIEWLEAHKRDQRGDAAWSWLFSECTWDLPDERVLVRIKKRLTKLKNGRWWWPF